MRSMRLIDIVLPLSQDIVIDPNVDLHDPLTHAIEMMVSYNLQQIVVVSKGFPIGIVRLADAFKKIGLQKGTTPETS
ncbi:MAG: CBS domain-containing protein [Syntrophobacteraceae bacterium]